MCAVCVEYQKGTITREEAEKALNEMIYTVDGFDMEHVEEIEQMISGDSK